MCVALLLKHSSKLKELDFQSCIIYLQSLSAQSNTTEDIEMLMSEAYVLKCVYYATIVPS